MDLIQELIQRKISTYSVRTQVHCKAFEDNSGAVEMARMPKMHPRTRHINHRYHHFRSYVHKKSNSIHQVRTDEQLADMLTKPLNQNLFQKLRKQINGW